LESNIGPEDWTDDPDHLIFLGIEAVTGAALAAVEKELVMNPIVLVCES
jgi:hypothetical protein